MVFYNVEDNYLVDERGTKVCETLEPYLRSVEIREKSSLLRFKDLPVYMVLCEFDMAVGVYCLRYSGIFLSNKTNKYGVLLEGERADELGIEYRITEIPVVVSAVQNLGITVNSSFGLDLTVSNFNKLN